MKKAYLLTGGNIGDRLENLSKASRMIGESCGQIKAISSYYETAAWGKEDQPGFLNQAIELATDLEPHELLDRLLEIETALGRFRDEKYGPRIIDIDIILYEDLVIDETRLRIPHPEMSNRRFVLTPLTEIAGKIMHPVFKKSMRQLLKECPDTLEVKLIR